MRDFGSPSFPMGIHRMIIVIPMYTVRLVHVMWPADSYTPETFPSSWPPIGPWLFEYCQVPKMMIMLSLEIRNSFWHFITLFRTIYPHDFLPKLSLRSWICMKNEQWMKNNIKIQTHETISIDNFSQLFNEQRTWVAMKNESRCTKTCFEENLELKNILITFKLEIEHLIITRNSN